MCVELSSHRDEKSGGRAYCVFNQLHPTKKGKQAEQAEVIAFHSEDKSGRFAIVFVIKTAEENGF